MYKNGRFGANAEHSWFVYFLTVGRNTFLRAYSCNFRGDAAITAHLLEYLIVSDFCKQGYDKDGNAIGEVSFVPKPERLKWSIDRELQVGFKDFFFFAFFLSHFLFRFRYSL